MEPRKYLETAIERTPMSGHVGKSGATLERLVLEDGRRLVVKRSSPGTDLLMALSGDSFGREYLMWSSGVLDQLPPAIGHAIVDGWQEEDVTVLVMRDLGDAVLTWDDRLSREQCRRVFAAVGSMYDGFLDRVPSSLTPLVTLVGMFTPDRIRPHAGGENPLPDLVLRGWELFPGMVPPDVAEPVQRLLARPEPLVDALRARPCTLVHGDLATVNMAFEGERLTLLDWSMPAEAPAALDLARFLAGCASVIDASREQVIEDFRDLVLAGGDEAALRLALLAGLLWLGWNKALDAAEHEDPAIRARERADLDWWVDEARRTLAAGLLTG
ncbi:hypothetical protein [Kribbella sp. NPDC003557]|uniref:hypothetical protein n=1 Tax=Kribbella sp. NPDC003557 TaxID=3154449 RepID=UPI0033B23D4D